MTIKLFPGAKLTPEVLLHQLLDEYASIRGLVVLRFNEDETVDVLTSRVSMGNLAFGSVSLQHYINQLLDGDPPDRATIHPPKDQA